MSLVVSQSLKSHQKRENPSRQKMSSLQPSPPPPQPPSPEAVVKNRYLGFLIWQSFPSAIAFILFKTLLLTPFTSTTAAGAGTQGQNHLFILSLLVFLFSFFTFQLAQLLFSASLSTLSSPHPNPALASPFQLSLALFRFIFVSGDSLSSPDFRRRARVSLFLSLFVAATGLSGFVSALSLCCGWAYEDEQGLSLIGRVGFRALVSGYLYAAYYVYKKRWVLQFPIIQRPPFFSFKMGIPLAIKQALKLSSVAYLISAALSVFLPLEFKSQVTMGKFITEQIILFFGIVSVFLCWELSHHLHQILQTKRFKFAPPQGSAAAEANPSEPLLAALEESTPNSLPQYLAYLDLCMVCENNVDTWRRAAFFEETGETYRRVIAVCIKPLEHLVSKLGEGLEGSVGSSNQLQSPSEPQLDSKYYELLNNFQQYSWCSRAVSTLTARSHSEDRYGIAQLSGSNAAVVSTLISCLLAIEASMGKKTNMQSTNQFMGLNGIEWASRNAGRRDVVISKKRSGPLHSKAYAVADVLRTSLYSIVSAFHEEMFASAKAGLLEKDWIINGKPLFGSRELIVQKLRLFLDFQAS